MSETMQDSPDGQVQASAPHRQPSLAPGDDAQVPDTVLSNAEPGVCEVSPSGNFRPTRCFPADPSVLKRKELESYYREMRCSHSFLARSRGQQKRHAKRFKQQRNELFNTLHHYEKQITILGREKVEVMQLAKSFQKDLEVFEQKDQALSQLLDELESAKEKTGFWSIFTITQLLERMRQLLRGGEIGQ